MTQFLRIFQVAIEKIESVQIPYIIVGSMASMIYGEPRLTRDMDLVIDIRSSDAKKFEELFPQPEFYCPPFEIVSDEINNRGQFNLLHVATGLKIDIIVKKVTDFDQSRFQRMRRLELWEGFSASVASPEDIIIKKLEFFREGGSEKHLRDIRGIRANTNLDETYLQSWINQLSLKKEWALI